MNLFEISVPNFDEQIQAHIDAQITEHYEPEAKETEQAPFINNDGSYNPDVAERYYA